jgi:hypothetical protein
MTLPSPQPPSHHLRPDQVSRSRQVLTESAPAPPEVATRPLVQMPTTAAPRDLAYTRALVAACQRMGAAPDTAALWRLAARPSDGAPDDTATAAVIETLFRQGQLQQPISIDDPAEGASWNELGRHSLLVLRIEGTSRQSVRLVWYVTRPATLAPYADLAEAFAQHASLALEAVLERDNLNRAVAARHRVGVAQGILMTRRQLTADQAFVLLKRESQNTHLKLRTIAQTVIQTGNLPVGTENETE